MPLNLCNCLMPIYQLHKGAFVYLVSAPGVEISQSPPGYAEKGADVYVTCTTDTGVPIPQVDKSYFISVSVLLVHTNMM